MAATIELEHAIGYAGAPKSLHYCDREYVYAAGGCVVITAFDDPHNQVFMRGHATSISSLVMSPSKMLMASAQSGRNSDILVWNYVHKSNMYQLSEHDYGVAALDFSHDDRLLLSAGCAQDGKLFVWDLQNGNIISTQQKMPFEVHDVAWGGMHRDVKRRDTSNYLFVVVGKKSVLFYVLNPNTGEMTSHPIDYSTPMARDYTCVQFSKDREFVFAGTTSGDFIVIHVKAFRVIQCVQACACGVQSILAFSNGLYVGGGDGSVLFFDHSYTDCAKAQLQGPVNALSISQDGTQVIAGTMNGFIYRLQHAMGCQDIRAILMCENHADAVVQVAYAVSSDRFATISTDCTIRIWDASDYAVVAKCFVQNAGAPTSMQYSADILVSGWSDGCIRSHNAENGAYLWTIDNAHQGGVTAVKLSTNQRFIVSGGASGDVRVWDIRKRDLVSHLKEHTMGVTDLVLFEDDIHLLSCSRDRSFLCWDLRQERRISSHIQRMGAMNAINLSIDQTQVVTVGQEKKISYWDLRNESPVKIIETAHADEALCIAVAHAAPIMATGGSDHLVKLWDWETGRLLTDGIGHSAPVRSLLFSPDDRQLVSVGEDGNIFVWNVYS